MFKELAQKLNPDDIYFAFSGGVKYQALKPVCVEEYLDWFSGTFVYDYFSCHTYHTDYDTGFMTAIGLFVRTAKVQGQEEKFKDFVSSISGEFCIEALTGSYDEDDTAAAIFYFIDAKGEKWSDALFQMLDGQGVQFWEGFMATCQVLNAYELFLEQNQDWPDLIE
jgi:hypothetical protein